MSDPIAPPPTDSAYIAHLWDHPQLTIAIFGLQVSLPAGFALYEAAGIQAQMETALGQAEGLLGVRFFAEGAGAMQFQYWRSHAALALFARQMPHTAWWKWLNDHAGQGISFYHEIYQCKTAEAVFELGSTPVGPATFCATSAVVSGEGRSAERQRRFLQAAQNT